MASPHRCTKVIMGRDGICADIVEGLVKVPTGCWQRAIPFLFLGAGGGVQAFQTDAKLWLAPGSDALVRY
jgi:hypothetical protein